MKLLLDTDTYVALMNGHASVTSKVRRVEKIILSAVVAGELIFGFDTPGSGKAPALSVKTTQSLRDHQKSNSQLLQHGFPISVIEAQTGFGHQALIDP